VATVRRRPEPPAVFLIIAALCLSSASETRPTGARPNTFMEKLSQGALLAQRLGRQAVVFGDADDQAMHFIEDLGQFAAPSVTHAGRGVAGSSSSRARASEPITTGHGPLFRA